MEDRPQKTHRAPHSGVKAEKKGKGKGKQSGFNEKAFAPKSGRRADKQARRNVERDQTRLHVPLVNRTPEDDPPPIIVAVVGPSGVGKTTLMRSLVRRYTKHTLSDIKGPVTVVGGKKRRLTLIECNNDLNCMIDIGKVADLVLLMIDGSFGFEMETFEFLNILQAHGFPKVIGVLTHLDLIKKAATLRATKKTLKKRFWTEIYPGAKLFYLSGVLNGRYPDQEVQNLSRFIGVMKFRPLVFRNSHPYLLADRLEDLTPRERVREEPKCDRVVTLYGYLRGTHLRHGMPVHVPGVGDLQVASVEVLQDPCPLPTVESERRRRLGDKMRLIHAPMSDVGGVMYDKDAVYVNVPGNFTRHGDGDDIPQGEGERMVMDLQDAASSLADGISRSKIRLFESSAAPLVVNAGDEASDDDSDLGSEIDSEGDAPESNEGTDDDVSAVGSGEGDEDDEGATPLDNAARASRRRPAHELPADARRPTNDDADVAYASSDSDLGTFDDAEQYDGEDDAPQWKTDLAAKARAMFARPGARDWARLIYETNLTPAEVLAGGTQEDGLEEELEGEEEDELFTVKKTDEWDAEVIDQTKETLEPAALDAWEDEAMLDSVRHLFITGGGAEVGREEDAMGDFEDLEGGEGNIAPPTASEADTAALAAKKEALKRKFDEQYDEPDDANPKADWYTTQKTAMAAQAVRNRTALAEGVDAGYAPGAYVRLQLAAAPCELVVHFDGTYPLIAGGLLMGAEDGVLGLVRARVKRHRWHSATLKTHDPLVVSLGWRRFQTAPLYALDDHSIRMRQLKYTPEHMHCFAAFWGPGAPPGTGLCAFNTLGRDGTTGFRVAATGVVLDVDRAARIVKKLKLTGVPYKIFRNTAFVKDMFTSALEVAKFEGAKIRTVSGVRGEVKKALTRPDGAFRASFEDKVLMSDIIFLRAWYAVEPRKFYNPVTSLLMAEKTAWRGMRRTGEVRRDEGLKTPLNVNSTYTRVERPSRRFNPLKVPRGLQAALPYASKPKLMKAQRRQPYLQKRAVVLEPAERRALSLLQQMRALRKDQAVRRREKQEERRAAHRKKVEKMEDAREEKEREKRKEYMRAAGMKKKREAEREEGGGGRARKRHKTG